MAGMVNRLLKGRAAITLLASSRPKATRIVVYTEPAANVQLPRNMQIANAFATVDRVISTHSRRDSTSMVTNPVPES